MSVPVPARSCPMHADAVGPVLERRGWGRPAGERSHRPNPPHILLAYAESGYGFWYESAGAARGPVCERRLRVPHGGGLFRAARSGFAREGNAHRRGR